MAWVPDKRRCVGERLLSLSLRDRVLEPSSSDCLPGSEDWRDDGRRVSLLLGRGVGSGVVGPLPATSWKGSTELIMTGAPCLPTDRGNEKI